MLLPREPNPRPEDETKTCRKCHRWLPRAAFPVNPRVSDGLSSWCKACQREATRQSRARYRDVYNRKRRKPQTTRSCAECAATFSSSHPQHRFCSALCRARWWEAHRADRHGSKGGAA